MLGTYVMLCYVVLSLLVISVYPLDRLDRHRLSFSFKCVSCRLIFSELLYLFSDISTVNLSSCPTNMKPVP